MPAEDPDQTIGVFRMRQRSNEDRVGHAEENGGGGDPECEREHSDRREAWGPKEVPQSVPKIQTQTVHQSPGRAQSPVGGRLLRGGSFGHLGSLFLASGSPLLEGKEHLEDTTGYSIRWNS